MAQPPSVTVSVSYPGVLLEPSFLDARVTTASVLNPGIPAGGTAYDVWCLNMNVQIPVPATYVSKLYSSYELGSITANVSTLRTNTYLSNLDNVNWLLNYYNGGNAGISFGEVQSAIWQLMGYKYPIAAYLAPQDVGDINALVSLALAHDGYVPDVGEAIGIVLDPTNAAGTTHYQPLIMETQAAKLGDFVWEDLDADGVQDAGEQGIAGATVELVRDSDGNGQIASTEVLAATVTDLGGYYSFKGLTPALEYQVRFTRPAGFDATSPRQADGSATSGANSDALLSSAVVLSPGQYNTSIDAGFYRYASLGDRVWHDTDGDGQQDAGEAGMAGVAVQLCDAAGAVVATTTTDAEGRYGFTGLRPGQYNVQFATPDGFVVTRQDVGGDSADSDIDATGLTGRYTLSSGAAVTTVDAGFYRTAGLGDRLWLDANGNGRQDAGEQGIAGQTVTLVGGGADGLIGTGDDTTATVTTDAGGNYRFTGLTPGVQYQVVFSKPEGAVFSTRNSGDDLGDSDADSLGRSPVLTLASGEDNTSVDAGVYMPVSIGNRVWEDLDANGLQDAGEPGMAGVTVQLRDATTGAVVATTTTNAQGNYLFTNLLPGYYGVQFVTPTGYVVTESDTGGGSGTSSSAVGGGYVLASGQAVTDADGGFYRLASLGNRLWLDANGDGRQDTGEAGVAEVTVTLVRGGADRVVGTADDITVSTTTDASGYYRFTGLMPGAEYQVVFSKPAGTVFTIRDVGVDTADSDADAAGRGAVLTLKSGENNTSLDAGVYVPASIGVRAWEDMNGNGVQDTGEAGIAGVTVHLRDATGAVVATTTTDAEGLYSFTGLQPGQYDLQFATPDGFVVTRQDVGGDSADSDIDGAGLSGRYTLASGDAVTTADAGFYRTASLGDRLWLDANGNGQQDAGEQGIAGQTVTLVGGGADGLIGTGDDTTATVTTDAGGNYRFTGLTSGVQYQVVFSKPDGAVFTGRDSGDDLGDSDVDAAGASPVVTLASGEDNTSLDAGVLVPRAGIDIEKYVHAEYTVETAGGTEGLTPGFWKNHTGAGGAPLSGWLETGLTPGMSFEALFGVDVPGSAPTLLQALGTNGGGVNALLRHASAALLNASHPNIDFLYTSAQVIAMVKQAFATASYDTVKNLLAVQNEKEADLGTPATGGTQLVVTADVDADTADTAAHVPVGGQAVFTYVVKNTGDFEIADVKVTDDRLPSLAFVGGDTDGDGRLDAGETWTYRASETVQAGAQQVLNIGTATGRDVLLGQALSDSDAAWYSTGATPPVTPPTPSGTAGIDLEKLVHAEYGVAASGTGGEGLTPGFWKNYTGDGGAPLSGWPETGLSPSASYEAIFGVDVPGTAPTLLQALGSEGGEADALLRHSAAALLNASNPNISYLYSPAQVLTMVKQAFATGSYEATKNLFATQNELGDDLATPATGSGTTHVVTADVDADTAADALLVPAGAEAVYTYVLKNTGSVALDNVSVSDDHLTGLTFAGGDANGDGRLDVGETWTYTARETVAAGAQIAGTAVATGHSATLGTVVSDSDATHVSAQVPAPAPTPAPSPSPEERVVLSFDFSGSSATDGTDGNTRTFTVDGLSVTAAAFSRTTNGQWSRAYVGTYAKGLGVTDASENGAGQTYTVDNSGRDNYLVFRFSQDVVVDKAFLGQVTGDSDLTAWIGSAATLPTSLSDALLAGLAREENDGSSAARWADLNTTGREGNLLVIAAGVKGGKADDQFLLDQLAVTTDDVLGLLGALPQHSAVY